MLNKKALAAARIASGTTTDADFEYVTMLLHGDGTNGAQNNTIIDGSTNNFTVTRNGNVTQGSLNPFGDRWSNYFDGNGDYLSIAHNTSLDLTSGDFTIEGWAYWTGLNATANFINKDGAFGSSYPQYSLSINGSGYIRFIIGTGNGTSSFQIFTSSTLMPKNTWAHIAAVKSGSNITLYQNGANVASATQTATMTSGSKPFLVGYETGQPTANYWDGYTSNIRIVKGTAVYTAAFTPPTAPLTAITNTSLLTCQSNRFRDNSSNNFTITRNGDVSVRPFSPFSPSAAYSSGTNGGSGYFDGSGDFLTVPSNTALAFGTGDFTAECWLYRSSTATMVVMDYATSGGFGFYLTSTQIICFVSAGTAYTATATVAANTWAHIAFARSGTTLKTYLNGTEVGSFTVSTNFTSPSALTFGRNAGSGADQFSGYISNLRLVKGTAVYTSNFTPPTAPLTAITNTSLLLNFTNGGIIDSAADNVLETVGNAQISTSVKKYGTGSLAFDGSGDYLQFQPSVDLEMGGGDFTWEFWIYPNSVASSAHILAQQAQDTTIQFDNGAGNILIVWDGANRAIGSVSTSQWTHVALVRSSGTLKVYLNGVATGSSWTNTSSTRFTLSSGLVGSRWGNTNNFNGYIDDLRITKGVARYTASFTPPTAAFPDL